MSLAAPMLKLFQLMTAFWLDCVTVTDEVPLAGNRRAAADHLPAQRIGERRRKAKKAERHQSGGGEQILAHGPPPRDAQPR